MNRDSSSSLKTILVGESWCTYTTWVPITKKLQYYTCSVSTWARMPKKPKAADGICQQKEWQTSSTMASSSSCFFLSSSSFFFLQLHFCSFFLVLSPIQFDGLKTTIKKNKMDPSLSTAGSLLQIRTRTWQKEVKAPRTTSSPCTSSRGTIHGFLQEFPQAFPVSASAKQRTFGVLNSDYPPWN